MRTEKEFSNNLRQTLRRAHRKQWIIPIIKQMGMTKNVYFAYEQGELPMTAYHLYKFMQITGCDIDFLNEVFDDNWRKKRIHKSQNTDNG